MSNFWFKNWSRSFTKFKKWSLTREFLKHYLTDKKGFFSKWSLTGGGRLPKVVAMRELNVLLT